MAADGTSLPAGLLSALEGSLPEFEIVPLPPAAEPVPEAPVTRPKRRTRPRAEWSQARIADRIGISQGTLSRYLAQHPELREILGRDGSRRRSTYPTTREQVEAAAEWIFRQPWWTWRTQKHTRCLRCGFDDSPHMGNGICCRCHAKNRTIKAGGTPWEGKPGTWCRKLGLDACLVCERSDRKHKGHGMCAPCHMWARAEGLEQLPERRRQAAIRRRRKEIRRKGWRKGGRRKGAGRKKGARPCASSSPAS